MSGMELLLQAATSRYDAVDTSSVDSSPFISSCSTTLNSNGKMTRSCSSSSSFNSSLPPKKRRMLSSSGYPHIDLPQQQQQGSKWARCVSDLSCSSSGTSSVANSEWTEIKQPQKNQANPLLLKLEPVIVPNNNKKSKKSILAGKKKKSASSNNNNNKAKKASIKSKPMKESSYNSELDVVKDLDGNDMCMGYFSSIMAAQSSSSQSSQSSVATAVADAIPTNNATAAAKDRQEASASNNDDDDDDDEIHQADDNSEQAKAEAKLLLYRAYLQAMMVQQQQQHQLRLRHNIIQ